MDTAFLQPSKNVEDRRGILPGWLKAIGASAAELYLDKPRELLFGKEEKPLPNYDGTAFGPAILKAAYGNIPWSIDYPAQYARAKALWDNSSRGFDAFGEWQGKAQKDRTRPWAMMGPPVQQDERSAFRW